MRSELPPPLPIVVACSGFPDFEEEARRRGARIFQPKPIDPDTSPPARRHAGRRRASWPRPRCRRRSPAGRTSGRSPGSARGWSPATSAALTSDSSSWRRGTCASSPRMVPGKSGPGSKRSDPSSHGAGSARTGYPRRLRPRRRRRGGRARPARPRGVARRRARSGVHRHAHGDGAVPDRRGRRIPRTRPLAPRVGDGRRSGDDAARAAQPRGRRRSTRRRLSQSSRHPTARRVCGWREGSGG
jgi:hypothetical protein